MTCVTNNESLFDLFDIATLGISAYQTDGESADSQRFATMTARSTPMLSSDFRGGPDEDVERWDGLS